MVNLANDILVNPDHAVINKIKAGHIDLFEILIRRYNALLYKIARNYGFNHQDAEDLLQDTHVSAYTSLQKFEGRSSYKTWIAKIMVNKCLYKLKCGYLKNEVPGQGALEPNGQSMYVLTKENPTEDMLLNHELASILEKSLQCLPVMYRTVFVLREVEGLSVAETAELLEIRPDNVKIRLNRAKRLLRKQVKQFYSSTEIYSFNLIYCDAIAHKVFETINGSQNRK